MMTTAEGAENGEVDRFKRRPPHHVDLREIGRHRAPDDIGHAVSAGDQILRPGMDDDGRLHNGCHQRQRNHEAQRQAERFDPAALPEFRGSRVEAQAASPKYSWRTASRGSSAHGRSKAPAKASFVAA